MVSSAPLRLCTSSSTDIALIVNGAFRWWRVSPTSLHGRHCDRQLKDLCLRYHFVAPLGIIHHRLYRSMVQSLQSVYGPAHRLTSSMTDRLQTSYKSGKQFEGWGIVWNSVSTGQGLTLGQKLLDQIQVISERSKQAAKRDEEERAGRRKDGSS